MGLSFRNTNGKAVKSKFETYTYKDGDQAVRLFGNVLPRYIYWVKVNGKDLPVECLSFDRNEERFTNIEKDWVRERDPEAKCGWAYAINCIDLADGKEKVLNLKKKLFEQIQSAAEDLEADPTDLESGFDIVFKKVKTGPHKFNVEYQLKVLACKRRALTADELATVEAATTIDKKFIRQTPDEIKAFLDKVDAGEDHEPKGDPNDDDIPF